MLAILLFYLMLPIALIGVAVHYYTASLPPYNLTLKQIIIGAVANMIVSSLITGTKTSDEIFKSSAHLILWSLPLAVIATALKRVKDE